MFATFAYPLSIALLFQRRDIRLFLSAKARWIKGLALILIACVQRRCSLGASPRLEPLRGLDREIGKHPIGAGALEAQKRFHHRPLAVEPATLGGGLDHRIF